MDFTTPEKMGISSKNIYDYVNILESNRLSTHDMIIMRGENIIYEAYWAPFNKDFNHRMYSVSKSIVAVAIGFLYQDGIINLDDKIIKYFPDEMKNQTDFYMREQTIKDMLMMCTAKIPKNWFDAKPDDRVRFYFENDDTNSRPPGTIFQYDSSASFVLGALIERLTNKSLIDFLKEKLFDQIGISDNITCLKCPGGHSWGDSGILCTARDLLKIARFVMNNGTVDGKQILDSDYIKQSVSKMVDNSLTNTNEFNTLGYGYYIWHTYNKSFWFNGMGGQIALCVPDKDIIMVYNGDNQGDKFAKKIIIDNFFDLIVNSAQDNPIKESVTDCNLLKSLTNNLKLSAAAGNSYSDFENRINGVTYYMGENEMGIEKFRLNFNENGGSFEYTNKQGDKIIHFGRCENVFGIFPQEGYSDKTGSETTEGFYYKCAASAAWTEPQKLFLKIQIIDNYFGRLSLSFGFRSNYVGINMTKYAENFLNEYDGFAGGRCDI